MKTVAVLLSVFVSVTSVAADQYSAIKLPLDEPFGSYDCLIQADTITAVTLGKSVYLYQIYSGNVLQKKKLIDVPHSDWRDSPVLSIRPDLALLFRGEDAVYLYQLLPNNEHRSIATRIPEDVHTYYLISKDSSQIIVFREPSRRFTLSSHNLRAEYETYSYCEIDRGVVSEATPIQSGRIISDNFLSILVHDTVYAVWDQIEHASFMTWVTDIRTSLVSARYDGTSWSEPKHIYDYPAGETSVRLLGLYNLNNQLYCIWKQRQEQASNDAIFYKRTEDRQNWSPPVKLLECSGYLNDFVAGNEGTDRLHLVIHESKSKHHEYYTFDGTRLEYKHDIELESVDPGVLVVDGDKPYLIYSKILGGVGSYVPRTITEKYITADGDTASVLVIDASPKDDGSKKADTVVRELFLIEL